MKKKEFDWRYELFKRHIIRHYLKIGFLEATSKESNFEIIIEDLKIYIYFLKKWTVFIAYDMKIEKTKNEWEFKQTCKSFELDYKWFFEHYSTLFAYIRDFNKRNKI